MREKVFVKIIPQSKPAYRSNIRNIRPPNTGNGTPCICDTTDGRQTQLSDPFEKNLEIVQKN
jgi:hypothetical protein